VASLATVRTGQDGAGHFAKPTGFEPAQGGRLKSATGIKLCG